MTVERLKDLGNGRWQFVSVSDEPAGTLTKTVEWDHKPTDEQLAYARNCPPLVPLEGIFHARRIGPLLYVKDVSPPAWPWPKVLFRLGHKWRIGIGWHMTAHYLVWMGTDKEN